MYQFYYSDDSKVSNLPNYNKNIKDFFIVNAVRPTMWEEHCLECSAPLCFKNCVHYLQRSDGRCMRFKNGLYVYADERGCCGQGVRVKFRKWADMMTIIFPAMLTVDEYQKMSDKNQKLGIRLKKMANGKMPTKLKWEIIRSIEYVRRYSLRKIKGLSSTPDAFIFHGYSFEKQPFNLIVEIFDDHTPIFKTAMNLTPGENLIVLDKSQFSKACWKENYLIKVYPENDLEVELDMLWCDFVKGKPVISEKPATNVKCVVWDLDNTVWDGVLIETDDTDKLKLNSHVLDTVKSLDERGIIQSVASKNDYENAWPVIEKLGLSDYFIYPQIHWSAKSESVEKIAKDLNIGIDTIALIDDSIFERQQVHFKWPQVRVYDAVEIPSLIEMPEFDVAITNEGKNRRLMYKAEEKRKIMQASDNSDTIEFLRKCNLGIELFTPTTESEKSRCYELVVRTNQLNMSGIKYTQQEFEEVLRKQQNNNFAFSCEDDFGSYGIVGFGQYKQSNNQIIFTEFAMSCRVAGKYVESALFNALLEKEKCDSGLFCVNKTKKNGLLRRTLEEIGFKIVTQDDNSVEYIFDTNLLNKEIVKCTYR